MPDLKLQGTLRAFRDVFASRALRKLELALAGSVIGDWAFAMALAVYAYQAGGATAVGLLALARWTAAGVAAPFLSVLADRYRRRTVMITADAIRLVAIAVAAVAAWTDASSLIVYASAIVTVVVSTAFQPAQTAMLPSLTSTPDQLTAANVVTSTIDSVGIFLGPALAGLALASAGTGWVMAFDAVTFAWSMLLLSGIPAGDPPVAEGAGESLLEEALGGFRAVAGDARLRLMMGLFGAQTLVCGALNVLIVVMALDLLDLGKGGVGSLNAAVGVGGLAGSVVAAVLVGRGRLAGNFAAGLVAWGVPIVLIAAFTNAGFAFAMLVIVGAGNVLVDVAGLTLLQRVVPDRVLGRVFGVLETVFALTLGVGGALAPLLINLVGVRGALVGTGALLPLLAAVTWPMLARFDQAAPEPARLALLRAVPFLSSLPETTLERINRRLERVRAVAGEQVFAQGDAGDRFYLIESGEVAVLHDGAEMARLGSGDYFGEIALVRDVPRTAGIRVVADAELLALDRDEFIAAVTGHAPSAAAADAVVTARLTGLRAGLGSV
jgi:MFS family permease